MRRSAPVLMLCFLLGGCSMMQSRQDSTPSATRATPPARDTAVEPVAVAAPDSETAEIESAYEMFEGTGVFINPEAALRPDFDEHEDGEIIFNFEGESLPEVVAAILGDLLEMNYVIAPGVQGQVTFSTSKPVSRDQVLPILEMLLSWNNSSMVHIDGRYHVIPTERAIRGQLRPSFGDASGQRGYEVRVFPLEYIAPTEMEKLLKPYAKQNAFVQVDNTRGLLALAGTPAELRNYESTIDIFDVDWLAGMSVGIYTLTRVEADTVVGELETVFGEGSNTPLAGMFRFMPIERLNAVMVITPQPEYLKTAVEWVERLDRGGSQAGTRLYVYEVRNVKAVDLSDTLQQVFGNQSSNNRNRNNRNNSNQVAPGLLTGEISSINDPRQRDQQEQTQTASAASGDDGLTIVDGESISITAVEESNALLIRATPGQYEAVLGAIKRLDKVPLQVLVEAKVLEVTLNNNLKYGVQWFFENAVAGFDLGGDSSGGNKGLFDSEGDISSDRSGSISGSNVTYSILGADVAATISALETETDVRTIAAPSMMVLNNKQATINVGTQIPVNSPIFNTGSGNNIGQSRVQFRDTGITLDVTPRVNPGGMVFMEVSQEVSAPIGTADVNGNVSVRQRRINTEIAVQNGETIVMGGLIQADYEKSQSGVPFLSRVPIVGGLFGNRGEDETRTELLVLITPRVVTSIDEARSVSQEYQAKMRALRPFDIENIQIDGKRDEDD